MLPISYQEALRALKDQAKCASAQLLAQDKTAMDVELVDAQTRMAHYPFECGRIVSLLLNSKDETLTIETLGEDRVANDLAYFIEQDICAQLLTERKESK